MKNTTRKPTVVMIDNKVYTESVLDCINCGSPMHLARDHFGVRYLCTKIGCSGTLGAHPNGSPFGFQVNAAAKKARIEAHDTYDRIWKHKLMSRTSAYRWLQNTLGSTKPVRIAELEKEDCEKVIKLVKTSFPQLFPFGINFD